MSNYCAAAQENEMPQLVVEISQELADLIKLAKRTKSKLQYDEGGIQVELTAESNLNANLYEFYNIVEEQSPLEELVTPTPTVSVPRASVVKLPEPPVVQEVQPPTIHIDLPLSLKERRDKKRQEAILSILRENSHGIVYTDIIEKLGEVGITTSTTTVCKDVSYLIAEGHLTCYNNSSGRGRVYVVLDPTDQADLEAYPF